MIKIVVQKIKNKFYILYLEMACFCLWVYAFVVYGVDVFGDA